MTLWLFAFIVHVVPEMLGSVCFSFIFLETLGLWSIFYFFIFGILFITLHLSVNHLSEGHTCVISLKIDTSKTPQPCRQLASLLFVSYPSQTSQGIRTSYLVFDIFFFLFPIFFSLPLFLPHLSPSLFPFHSFFSFFILSAIPIFLPFSHPSFSGTIFSLLWICMTLMDDCWPLYHQGICYIWSTLSRLLVCRLW